MKIKIADNYEMELQEVVDASLKFWEATRINGASSSVADCPGVLSGIVQAFDKIRDMAGYVGI